MCECCTIIFFNKLKNNEILREINIAPAPLGDKKLYPALFFFNYIFSCCI